MGQLVRKRGESADNACFWGYAVREPSLCRKIGYAAIMRCTLFLRFANLLYAERSGLRRLLMGYTPLKQFPAPEIVVRSGIRLFPVGYRSSEKHLEFWIPYK